MQVQNEHGSRLLAVVFVLCSSATFSHRRRRCNSWPLSLPALWYQLGESLPYRDSSLNIPKSTVSLKTGLKWSDHLPVSTKTKGEKHWHSFAMSNNESDYSCPKETYGLIVDISRICVCVWHSVVQYIWNSVWQEVVRTRVPLLCTSSMSLSVCVYSPNVLNGVYTRGHQE